MKGVRQRILLWDAFVPGIQSKADSLHTAERSAATVALRSTQLPVSAGKAEMWQTSLSQSGSVLEQHADVAMSNDFSFVGPVIEIDRATMGQRTEGFGGAFTEASAVVFSKLGPEWKKKVVEDYWGPTGIGYTLGRIHINSCDFSTSSYSFDEVDGDFGLTYFDDSAAHDKQALIPFVSSAQDALKSQGKKLKLLASPWSPPAWMKTNRKMETTLDPCLREGAQSTWANYISRWISAYKNHGVDIWGITVQNEPENNATWEACRLSANEEGTFLASYLGPIVAAHHREVLIFVFDHNKDNLYKWAKGIYSNPAAATYTAGVAFHWYGGDHFGDVQRVHDEFPQALLLPTEATYEKWRWHNRTTVESGDWSMGQGYAHDIIGDLNAGSVGWIDWNLLLDHTGGPNHFGNSCDAAMMTDSNYAKVFHHPQYHFIGHFSRYILPGSRHLKTTTHNNGAKIQNLRSYGTCDANDGLQATSFLRQDGKVAVVVLNCGDAFIDFKIADGELATLGEIPPRSIQTYLLDNPRMS